MSRADHLTWAKKRATDVVKSGDIKGGYASMVSDMQKHPELAGHMAIEFGMLNLMAGNLDAESDMLRFIDGFA